MNYFKFIVLIYIVVCSSFTLPTVDLIVYNATIFTVNNKQPKATVMVINKGKFLEVGGKELMNQYHAKTTLNAKGQFIYPGFIDAHCHFTGYALDKKKLDLGDAKSLADFFEKIKNYSRHFQAKQWIIGRNWNEENWTENKTPSKESLDKAFPNNPIFLLRYDGHSALINQQAINLTHLKNVEGVIYEHEIEEIQKILPTLNEQESIKSYQETEQLFFKNGLTAFVDCMVEKQWLQLLQKAYQQKKITIPAALFLTNSTENIATLLNKKTKRTTNNYKIAGLKLFYDGSFGSRTALLSSPYSDDTTTSGHVLIEKFNTTQLLTKIANQNYQIATHCIGDEANKEVLFLYSQFLKPNNNKRWRIEHAQFVDTADLHLFKKYAIVPSVQPTHAISDMHMATNRIGKARLQNAYTYHQLLQQNHWLPLGTDFPVEEINPLRTFCTAVFRKNKDNEPINGFQIENALSREEALKGMTIWAAKSVFWEHKMGSIEVGKDANFIILSTNLMQANLNEIYNANIEMTYLNGKEVFSKKKK